MKKRVLALLLCLLTAFSAAAEEEAPLKKRRTESGLFYVKADHRYFNNAGHFGVSRIKSGVRLLNAAIDALEPHIPVSLYLAESSRSHLIERTFPEDSEVYRYLLEHLHADQADHLKYSTYRQFCEYFYATDHHWNYRGSYQAYADIVYMLFGEDEPYLTPDEKVTLPVKFQGSFAKQERNPVSEEYFAFYRFDRMPAYETYVNGEKAPYGNMEAYLRGAYGKKKYENHYSRLYGGDVAQVVLETGRDEGPVLLMLCNSLASPVKPLLTQHFRRVVCVDLRFYRQEFHRDFSLKRAVKEFEVDQILLLGDVKMFIDVENIVP